MPGVDFYKKRAAAEAAMARMKERAKVLEEPPPAPGRPMNRRERRAAKAKGGK
jgi:hypothetical protein